MLIVLSTLCNYSTTTELRGHHHDNSVLTHHKNSVRFTFRTPFSLDPLPPPYPSIQDGMRRTTASQGGMAMLMAIDETGTYNSSTGINRWAAGGHFVGQNLMRRDDC